MSETREKLIEILKALGLVLLVLALGLAAGPFLEGFRDGWRGEAPDRETPATHDSAPKGRVIPGGSVTPGAGTALGLRDSLARHI